MIVCVKCVPCQHGTARPLQCPHLAASVSKQKEKVRGSSTVVRIHLDAIIRASQSSASVTTCTWNRLGTTTWSAEQSTATNRPAPTLRCLRSSASVHLHVSERKKNIMSYLSAYFARCKREYSKQAVAMWPSILGASWGLINIKRKTE